MQNEETICRLPAALLPWYKKNARVLPWRNTRDPYRVWLSEIMLQQTRVSAVIPYYQRFLEALPTIYDLAAASDETLLKLWEGLGYYTRARNLKKAANVIVKEYNGKFPDRYEDILSLPGIGEYTAGAICSICFDHPTPAVDGNVLRVLARLTDCHESISEPNVKRAFRDALSYAYPEKNCGIFTQSLMELGALICVPNGAPNCTLCPLNTFCIAFKNKTQDLLPVRAKKPERKKEHRTVFLLESDGFVAVKKREEKGLLNGLWEFPNTPCALNKKDAVLKLKEWGVVPKDIVKSSRRKHIFTHIEWEMECFYFTCENKSDAFLWVSPEKLQTEIALPTAFRKFCALLT